MRAITQVPEASIKVVGKSGQISLGKRYAGMALRVEHRRDGTIILTAVAVVPKSQLWTLEEPHRSRIRRGLAWAAKTAPAATAIDALAAKSRGVGGHSRRRQR